MIWMYLLLVQPRWRRDDGGEPSGARACIGTKPTLLRCNGRISAAWLLPASRHRKASEGESIIVLSSQAYGSLRQLLCITENLSYTSGKSVNLPQWYILTGGQLPSTHMLIVIAVFMPAHCPWGHGMRHPNSTRLAIVVYWHRWSNYRCGVCRLIWPRSMSRSGSMR